MPGRGELWVHGNSAMVEFPGGANPYPYTPGRVLDWVDHTAWTDVVGRRRGDGVTFQGKPGSENTNYFHFSMPTPVVVPQLADNRLLGISVDGVSLLWDGTNALLEHVFVWDGNIFIHDCNLYDSDHTAPTGPWMGDSQESRNTWTAVSGFPPALVKKGIGITAQVKFLDTPDSRISFASAGIFYELVEISMDQLAHHRDEW